MSSFNTGGYLELSTSNSFVFSDSIVNDLILTTDGPTQSILIGTDNNETGQSTIKITNNALIINKKIDLVGDLSVGTSNSINRFTMVGSNNNLYDSPSMAFLGLNDSNPIYQQLNLDHDNISQNYDAFYDGTNWLSSSSNSAYQIMKSSNRWMIASANVNNAGEILDNIWNNALVITSNSWIGINTLDPYNRFHISGPGSSTMGPHLVYGLDSDSNPLKHDLNWDRDQISTGYDMFYNGNSWIAGGSNPFLQQKAGGQLSWYSSCNNIPGQVIDNNLEIAFSINSNQFLGIGTSNMISRITVSGPSNSLIGPHISYMINDNLFPLYQEVYLEHNMMFHVYDGYWNGSNLISSDSNANFVVNKSFGMLQFLSGFNNIPGSQIDSTLNTALSISSNSWIGIGTDLHTARITISGPSNNIQGPHTNYHTDDDSNFPVYQQYISQHDDITQGYDVSYIDGSWISSSSNGNFQIKKYGGKFIIFSACNLYPGTIANNWMFPALTVNSNSWIGVGTSNPTHRFTIIGDDMSSAGPHTAIYTSSDLVNPIYQQYISGHDGIAQGYDTWYNGTNWLASTNGGSFMLSKSNNQLTISGSCNNTIGAINNFTPNLVFASDGSLGFGTSNTPFKFNICGPSNSAKGPNLSFYTNDDIDNPIFQQVNCFHDLIMTNYDMYWDGSNLVSSSCNSSFQILKTSGALEFLASSNLLNSNIVNLNTAMSIGKNSYVDIGGSNPKWRLNIIGMSNSLSGPHQAFYVNSDCNNPVYLQLNNNHDDINTLYDCYFDGENWISSSPNGNYLLSKSSNNLTWSFANGNTPGSQIVWQPEFSLANNGFVGINDTSPNSRLSIRGLADSVLGPHMIYSITGDTYPMYSQFNLDHDNINTGYDTYWDGTNWISGSSNGSFQIQKSSNVLMILSSSNAEPGTINQFTANLVAHQNSFIGIGSSNPVTRLTLGGPAYSDFGPHLSMYVDDGQSNQALFQILNLGQNNISLNFDQSWNSSNFISNTGTSYQISKTSNLLSLLVSSNDISTDTPQTISSPISALTINSDGQVGVLTSNQTFDLEIVGRLMVNQSNDLDSNISNFDFINLTIQPSQSVPPVNLRNSNLPSQYTILASSVSGANLPNNIWDNDLVNTFWQTGSNYDSNSGLYLGSLFTQVHGSNYYGDWTQISLPFNFNLNSYQLQSFTGGSSNNSVRNFFLLGSFDCYNWDQLDYEANLDNWTSIPGSNVSSIEFIPETSNVAYPNYRFMIEQSVASTNPVINYIGLTGDINNYDTRMRILSDNNTLVLGNSNANATLSNGCLNITSNLFVYGSTSINSTLQISSNFFPSVSGQYNIGTSNLRWSDIFITSNGIDMDSLVLANSTGALAVQSAITNIPQRIIVKEILLGSPHDAINSNVYLLTASSNGLGITNASSNASAINYTQFNNLYITNINLGIGTSNPSESLDIAYGNLKVENNAYVLSNLGIGTSNPSERLELRGGNTKLSSNLYVLNGIGIGSSNLKETFTMTAGNMSLPSNLYVGYNIGVGTSNPSESVEITCNLKVDGNSYVMDYLGVGTSNPSQSIETSGNALIDQNLYIGNNVGVGTQNPIVNNSPGVHVIGDIRADSNIIGNSNLIVQNNAMFGDCILRTVQRSLNVALLSYQNICIIDVSSTLDNPNFTNTYQIGVVLAQGETYNTIVKKYNFAVTGNVTNNSYLRVFPNNTTGPAYSNDFDLEIMTTSTYSSLRIIRTATSSVCSSNNITCFLEIIRPTNSFLQVQDDMTSNYGGITAGIFPGTMLLENQFTGNIGINSSNPSVSLDIRGTDAILVPSGTQSQRPSQLNPGLIRYNTTTSQFEGFGPANSWGSLGGTKSVDQLTYIAAELFPGSGDGNLRFVTENVERMRIDSNGIVDMWSNVNVGGTFQAVGNCAMGGIDIADGLYTNSYTPYITVNMSGAYGSGSNCGLAIEEAGAIAGFIASSGDRLGFQFKPPGGSPWYVDSVNGQVNFQNNTLVLNNNGFVGINTTSPNYQLDVFGTINAAAILVNGNSISGGGGGGGSGFWASVYSNVVTYCNVGIGLSNPSALLHLIGGNTILGCNLSVGSNLLISGGMMCSGTLSNNGNANFSGILNANNLIINRSSTNFGTQFTQGNAIFGANLTANSVTVSNSAAIGYNLNVTSNISADSLNIMTAIINNGDLNANGNTNLNNTNINGQLSTNSSGLIGGDLVVNGNVYMSQNCTASNSLSNIGNVSFSSNAEIHGNLIVDQNIIGCNCLSNIGNLSIGGNTVVNDITILGTQYVLGGTSTASNLNFNVTSNLYVSQSIFSSNLIVNTATFSNNVSFLQTCCNLGPGIFTGGITANSFSNTGTSYFNGSATFSNTIVNLGGALFRSNVSIQNLSVINNTSFGGNLTANTYSNLGDMFISGNVSSSTISNLGNVIVGGRLFSSNIINSNNILNSCNITTSTLSNLMDAQFLGNVTSSNIAILYRAVFNNLLTACNILTSNFQTNYGLVTNATISNLLTTVSSNLTNASIGCNLTVNTFSNINSASFSSNIVVYGNSSNLGNQVIGCNLLVGGNTMFNNSISVNSNLSVSNTTSNLGSFYVASNFITSGSVGIGTTSPLASLQIIAIGNKKLQFDNDITTKRHIVLFELSNDEINFSGFGLGSNSLTYQTENSNRDHVFSSGTSESLRITGGGSLGLGTSNPSEKTEIVGNVKISSNIYIGNQIGVGTSNPVVAMTLANFTNNNVGLQLLTSNGEIRLYNSNDHRCYLGHNMDFIIGKSNLPQIFASSNGMVGISNTSPNYAFDVTPQSKINNLVVWSTSNEMTLFNSSLSNIAWTNTSINQTGISNMTTSNFSLNHTSLGRTEINSSSNQPILFKNANSEVMRINSNLYVGINTSNPNYQLDVAGVTNSSNGYRLPVNGIVLTGRLSEMQNDMGFVTQASGSGGVAFYNTVTIYSSGPVISVSNVDPGDMITTAYPGSNNRYGMGQYSGGATRLFASGSNPNASVNLSVPLGNGQGSNATFADYLTMRTINGYIGINTSSPQYNLDIAGNLRVQSNLLLGGPNVSVGTVSQVGFGNSTITSTNYSGNNTDMALNVLSNNTKKIGLYLSGSNNLVGINTGNPQYGLDIISPGVPGLASNCTMRILTSTYGVGCQLMLAPNNNTSTFWKIGPDQNMIFNVYNMNNVGVYLNSGSTNWVSNSSIVLKRNIYPIESPLETTMRINGYTYNWKHEPESSPKHHGFLAEELQDVLPELTSKNSDGILGVSYTEMIPLLLESVKELKRKNDGLKRRCERNELEIMKIKQYLHVS